MGFAEANSHTVSGHWFDWAQLGSREALWFCCLDVVGLRVPKPALCDISGKFNLFQLILFNV